MKEDYFKYIFPKKKIRKENKTKTKIKRTSKRNALVLRTFNYENNYDRHLEEAHNPLPASELWVTEINIIRIWLWNTYQ